MLHKPKVPRVYVGQVLWFSSLGYDPVGLVGKTDGTLEHVSASFTPG